MRSVHPSSLVVVAVVAVLAVLAAASPARAQRPGTVIVVGNADAKLRTVVESAIASRARDAAWSMIAAPFAEPEVQAIVACLKNDRPWPCVEPAARARGVEGIVIAQVDRPRADQVTIVAQLLVAGNRVPAISDRH